MERLQFRSRGPPPRRARLSFCPGHLIRMTIPCPQCGGETLRGDVRSGVLSFGSFFVEHEGDKRTFTGGPKPRPGVQRDNRVVSVACTRCGLVSSYLERVVRDGAKT